MAVAGELSRHFFSLPHQCKYNVGGAIREGEKTAPLWKCGRALKSHRFCHLPRALVDKLALRYDLSILGASRKGDGMFETVAQGFVTDHPLAMGTAVAVGPRCAITADGEVVCSYMIQSGLGVNDFVPMLSRSRDHGVSWSTQQAMWPELREAMSIFGSVSASTGGELLFFGTGTAIDEPGERFWSDEEQCMKQNELLWARSEDAGHTWSDPALIPMPVAGAAEAPGAMCITRGGKWLCCYAPYKTFDLEAVIDRSRIVCLMSDDRGATWRHTNMLRFDDPESGGAEAWVIELADGRLLGTCWHIDHRSGNDYPNAYSLSLDGGDTWLPTRSTAVRGQSTALAPLPDGGALFIYNRRKHPVPGVCLAVVSPTASDFAVQANEVIWTAATATRTGSSGEHGNWTDFAFGEPSITLLPDDTLLATLWFAQSGQYGIRYVKLRMSG